MLREHWKTNLGFLLAAIGCAVGLGNIWRFPYMVYKSGGGAFFIPYLVAVFLVGIPLMILEQGIGQMEQGSAPLTFRKIRKGWEWLGWWAVIFTGFGIACYYNVILSWCANYLYYSFDLSWGSDPGAFFSGTFLNATDSPFHFGGMRWPILYGFFAMWVVTWLILHGGIAKGIESTTKFFIPVLFILVGILIFWSLSLPGAGLGIKAYLTPDFSRIWDSQIWRDAFGQVFFSMSLGYGMMITYASYLPEKTDINKDAIIVALSNSGFEVFAGFAVFATLGFMATKMGVPVDKVAAGGPGLSFVTYPQAINELPFGQRAFGILFFLSLILAGITSMVALMECFIAGLQDKFGWTRHHVVNGTCLLSFGIGLVFCTGAGVHWLDIVDHIINQFGVVAVALLQTIIVTRVMGTQKFLDFVNPESSIKIGPVWRFSLTVFIPLILIAMLATGIIDKFHKAYGDYSWAEVGGIGFGWLGATLLLALFFTRARWRNSD